MKFIKKIIRDYDLSETITNSLSAEIEDAVMEWWQKQSSELTQMLLVKENRIRRLEKRSGKH